MTLSPLLTRFLLPLAVLAGAWLSPVMAADGPLAIPRPAPESGPTEIGYLVWIGDITKVDSVEQSFRMNFMLGLHWHDPSLKHAGPGVKTVPLTSIWHPSLLFSNEAGGVSNSLPSMAEVSPEGDVIYRQRLVGNFTQPLDLSSFPFDKAAFNVNLLALGYTPQEVSFIPDGSNSSHGVAGGIGRADRMTLQDWSVTGISARPEVYKVSPGFEISGISFGFTATRNCEHFILKVILPLVLIVMMSWAVFWIDPADAGPQFSIAVTSMLTLISYRFAIESNVPKLPYLTRMDAFILVGSVLIFCSLVEVTIVSKLVKDGRLELGRTIDRHCRWVFPLLFVVCAGYTLSR